MNRKKGRYDFIVFKDYVLDSISDIH